MITYFRFSFSFSKRKAWQAPSLFAQTEDKLVLYALERNNKTVKEKVYYNETINWKSDVLTKYSFFYRGHYDFDYYRLVPSVMRQGKGKTNELNKEDYYYHQIKVQCADSFQNSTHIIKCFFL